MNREYLLSVPNLYVEKFVSCDIVRTRSSIRFSRCVPFPLVTYVTEQMSVFSPAFQGL